MRPDAAGYRTGPTDAVAVQSRIRLVPRRASTETSVSYRGDCNRAGRVIHSKWCIYFATPRGLAVFGGSTPGKIKNLCQVTHDLHVAAVYLTYRHRWPHDARCWVGEDFLAPFRRKQKLPDAMLVNAQTRTLPRRGIWWKLFAATARRISCRLQRPRFALRNLVRTQDDTACQPRLRDSRPRPP